MSREYKFQNNDKLYFISFAVVKAVVEEKAEEYLYSSARDYYTGKAGMVELVFLEPLHVFV